MAVTHKKPHPTGKMRIAVECGAGAGEVIWMAVCEDWVHPQEMSLFWKYVTCEKCQLKAPLAWRRKWKMAAR